MDTDKLVQIVKHEFNNAVGIPGGVVSEQRRVAMARYMGELRGDEKKTFSKALTSDVEDVVDNLMPSLMRQFTGDNNVAYFKPEGPDDIAIAKQQSDFVNHVYFEENDAFINTFSWLFDAALQKIGIMWAGWEESVSVREREFEGLTADELGKLELELGDRGEMVGRTKVEGENGVQLFNVTYKITERYAGVKLEPIPGDEYRISADHNSINPAGARLVGRERQMTRSDLVEMGFQKEQIEELPTSKVSRNYEKRTRDQGTNDNEPTNTGGMDKSMELVDVQLGYVTVDFDDDGIAELREVWLGGGQLLRWEKDGKDANTIVDRNPMHVMTLNLVPHRHIGRCPGDKMVEQEGITTTLLRQTLDNLYRSNQPGHLYWNLALGEDTLEDLLSTQVGQTVGFDRPPQESYMPLTVPFTAGNSFQMLDYFEMRKKQRTGSSIDSEALDPDALKNIQQGVMHQATDLALAKVELMAQSAAETGFKSLFLHIEELVSENIRESRTVNIRDEFVEIDPRSWRRRQDMTVNIGLGVGSKERARLNLDRIFAKQTQLWEAGGKNVLLEPEHIYNSLAEDAKQSGFLPAMFYKRPEPGPAPEEDDGSEAQLQLAQQQMQLLQQQIQVDAQRAQNDRDKLELNHQREMMRLEQQRNDAEDRMQKELFDAQLKAAELEADLREKELGRPLEQAERESIIELNMARAAKERALERKALSESNAQDLETAATESGLVDLANAAAGGDGEGNDAET